MFHDRSTSRGGVVVLSLLAIVGLAVASLSSVAVAIVTPPAGPITITSPGSGGPPQPASPYPSTIIVSGETGTITNVDVHLTGVTHAVVQDLDILLVGPGGQNIVIMSDVSADGGYGANNANITFDDSAASGMPATGNVTGTVTYRPTNAGAADTFPSPAPALSGNTTLAGAFNGQDANGTWSLYVVDDLSGDNGSIGGWNLTIDTEESAEATTTAVTSSVNPSTFGESVTLTATVTSAGTPVTSGSITFADGVTALGTVSVNGSGQAVLTTSALTLGAHSITAGYGGAPGFLTSSDSLTQVVNSAATATMLTSSVNPSNFGESVTFTATVTSGGSPVTAGAVTFRIDGSSVGTVSVDGSGEAVFVTSVLETGTHLVAADYDGATGLAASSDTLDQVVDGVADAGGPYNIDEGDSLLLDGTASLAGPGATYDWDANGDGVFGDATGPSPTLTWPELESLGLDGTGVASNVTLRMTDGATFTAVSPLTIANVAPTATLANDGPVGEGATADVTFSGQADPSTSDLAMLTYSYDFDNDGTFEVTASSSPSATVPGTFLSDGPGTRTVRAVVSDDDGGSLELLTVITITNSAPTATIDGPSTATVGVPVTIKVGALDPSQDDMLGMFLFTVDWGDGSPLITMSGPADPPVSHTYSDAGLYTVTATATDPDGATSEPLTFSITVSAAAVTTTTPVVAVLPLTGSGLGGALIAALALLLAGFGLVAGTRSLARSDHRRIR